MRKILTFVCVFSWLPALFAGPAETNPNTPDTLKSAINDLTAAFGAKYPRGGEFLQRLQRLPASDSTAFSLLQREALLANPLVSGQPVLFVSRPPYPNVHGPDETMYQSNEPIVRGSFQKGGMLKLLDAATGTARTIVSSPNGMVRDPDVHFDGKKILFSMRKDIDDDYHLYEIDADGSNLRQLTFAPKVSDLQPVYLPDGRIMFSSTREPKYIHCQRHLMASLFLMEGDGANIRQVGFNTLFEGRNSLTPDGKILYSRWEYVDKHFSSAYGLWTVNADGTSQTLYYGGLAWQPGAIIDGRIIPGTRKAICIFGSVHGPEYGAMVVVDPDKGNDGPHTVERSWPADIGPYLKSWNTMGHCGEYDSFLRIPLKYANPYPLSEKYFLCSRMLAPGDKNKSVTARLALVLVDVFGNEVLLHDEEPGCYQPKPLVARERPPVIPDKVNYADENGLFYVYDVYRGEKMESVKRGSVKAIRIVEAPAKLTYPPNGIGDWGAPDYGESHHPVAMNWNQYNNKVIIGTVPVEEDGSACFRVPAGRFVYFQLLDKDGMMVHSMRSGTSLMPGERAGCIGCHDYRSAPASSRVPLALQRQPSEPAPWYGPCRPFSYAVEVQPVFDRHCVKCHDFGTDGGKKINLSGDIGLIFNASYCSLMARSPGVWSLPDKGEKKPLISSIGSGPLPVVVPYSWGSHRSRLVDVIKSDKYKLTKEEIDRIVTWIDLNAPYYPDYPDYYTLNTYGRSPLNHKELLKLGQIILAAPDGKNYGWNNVTAYIGGSVPPGKLMGRGDSPLPVNFTRPEFSACLRAFPDKSANGYAEALSLIKAGAAMLKEHPRVDMPGFKPCENDRERLDFHALRRKVEANNREALAKGLKVYDKAGP
jgi:hypothetical protein